MTRLLALAATTLVALAALGVCLWCLNQPAITAGPSGPAFKELPWKHLPDLEPFELVGAGGERFSSSALAGRPYVVCFFYSTCPSICRQLNAQVQRLAHQFRETDLQFLSISVDPDTDTPQRLKEYAELFPAEPNWRLLTGLLSDIRQVGERGFRVVVQKEVHTEELLLVDRWGRFRDRFQWDDSQEMQRFARVAQEVVEERQPPLAAVIRTRNLVAGNPHEAGNLPKWLREFFLLQTDGSVLYSRDLTGEVWIGSVFFAACTTHCIDQNRYLRDLQDRMGDRPVRLLSFTTDPWNDTPERLSEYARTLRAQPGRWLFLTSRDPNYILRVANEYLGLFVHGSDHATSLVVIDRWGRPRGTFSWRDPLQEGEMFKLVDQLLAETEPPRPATSATQGASSSTETNSETSVDE